MVSRSPWAALYENRPDGRAWISVPKGIPLDGRGTSRILETAIGGRSATVLLLDKPFRLSAKVESPDADAYWLHRIALRELPGWPPKMLLPQWPKRVPVPLDCSLKSARFDVDGIEFELDYWGVACAARLEGCPVSLLKCAEATLNQGAIDNRLVTLQDAELIGG